VKGNSRLSWPQAKSASRSAWEKVERAIPGDSNHNGI
jgi:predicted metalloenzyme YecM